MQRVFADVDPVAFQAQQWWRIVVGRQQFRGAASSARARVEEVVIAPSAQNIALKASVSWLFLSIMEAP